MPLLSIILPFFNPDPESFNRSIESIAQQTFTDWELILINNNSNEESLVVAEKWKRKNRKVRLIAEKEQGIAFALNHGIQQASGRLIARMDADDISFPSRLEQQIKALDHNPQLGVVSCQTSFHSTIQKSEGYALFVDWQNSIITEKDHSINRFIESPIAHPTVVFRRELIEQFGSYTTEKIPEDYELWLRWMNQNIGFYKIPKKLYRWNDHAARLSRTSDSYLEEAFMKVKCSYLSEWIKSDRLSGRKIFICGTGKKSLSAAKKLEENGGKIDGFTDVVKKEIAGYDFIKAEDITNTGEIFYINFIAKRGVGKDIRAFFIEKGLVEGKDFLLAG